MHENLAKRYTPGKELVQSEAFASKVLEACFNGIYIYDFNQELNVFINARYTRLTGYTLEDLQSLDRNQFLELFHPDDHPRIAEHMQKIKNGCDDPAQIEYRFKTKYGRWIWCLSSNSAFARDKNGSVTHFIGSFIDVTARKEVEQERFYRQLATHLPNGAVFVVDHELRYLLAVGQGFETVAVKPSDLEGKTVFEVLGKESAQFEPYLRKALDGKPFRLEHFNLNRHFMSHGTPLRDAQGDVYAALVISYDISEPKASEEHWSNAVEISQAFNRLHETNRELEQRVAERTAEIESQYKTLEKLNTIIKQLSRKTIAAIENDRKALSKEIHDNIGGSLSAIKMMLETDFNRSGAPSKKIDREIIKHLADTIKETKRISFQMRSLALDEFGLQAAIYENIRIFKSFHPNISVIFQAEISPEKLPEEITLVIYRVVQEGLNNIGKHSGVDEVKIVLSEVGKRIHIEIEDNGRGFEDAGDIGYPDAIQYLGVQSIKERVEICDGTFQIDSFPGKGSRLKASIPKKI